MFKIPGYGAVEKRYESSRSLIYRAIRNSDGIPVMLKVMRQEYPSPSTIARFQLEHEILQRLNLAGVIKAYRLETYQQSHIIVLEDFGGISLQEWLRNHRFTLEAFLVFAIQITSTLGSIHQHQIIHKDINPSNILLGENAVKLIDFGIATVLSRETPEFCNPSVLEGTLAYMSPEQTGRMNRAIDYRTDFYSLGVTFYQLLCDRLPFQATDALELVHSHLARQPIPPHQVNPAVPQPVSDLVMKLLAKNAEDRYQSAHGICADLQECLNQLQHTQHIEPFPMARWDISSTFQIPQKLYGREQEVESLLVAFERVMSTSSEIERSSSELILVTGQPGIGKTRLVQELYKPITQQRGYFITGKYEQFQRDIPYFAIIQAFRGLIRQLLTESEAQINEWRQRLFAALGDNAQVVTAVIPDVALLIGQQPEVIELPPTELQNRFHLVLERFIHVFTQPSVLEGVETVHPLVIFLDDLQWADRASLQLIQQLMTTFNEQHLLVIGAYRDNEVDVTHPLVRSLNAIQQAGATVHQIALSPLRLEDLQCLIQETLYCDAEQAQPFARLILQKTDGNPFFINEFLRSLYQEKLIYFDPQQNHWAWNLHQIQTVQLADNVVELVTARIQELPAQVQQVLCLAACIGSQFNLTTLTIVSTLPQTSITNALNLASQANFITPLEGSHADYKFLHDRVQQAAYALTAETQRIQYHLEIGQYLLRSTLAEQLEDKIFDIVDHLNRSKSLIVEQSQKYQLARLNLIAGRKAKAAIAYEPAVQYLTTGIQLLPASSWETDYDLTLALYTEGTEAEFLNLNFEQAHQFAEQVIQHASTLLDSVRVYEIQMQFHAQQNQMQDTLDMGLYLLEMLDVPLSQSLVADVQPETLANLPSMTEPTKLAAMRILMSLAPAAYVVAPTLFAQIPTTLINLCIQYGNSPLSPVAYGFRGLALCASPDGVELGYRFAHLALNLLEHFHAKEIKSQVHVIFNGHIRHWKEHVKASIPALLEGMQSGLETGSLEYAGYNTLYLCDHLFFTGEPLEFVLQHQTQHLEAMLKLKQDVQSPYLKIWRVLLLKLLDAPEADYQFRGDRLNETELLQWSISADKQMFVFAAYLSRVIWSYFMQDYQHAITNAHLAEKYQGGIVGLLIDAEHTFYYALALLAYMPDHPQIAQQQEKLHQWATHAPMNFLHKFYLVQAEQHRVLGQTKEAIAAYDHAISLAQEHEYLNEAAIAHELAGKFYLTQGNTETAQTHLLNARHCYLRWGAMAKVKDLDRRYPELQALLQAKTELPQQRSSTLLTTGGSTTSVMLDLTALMKASQSLSSEIVLDKLVSKLMTILMENAGAQRGCLLLDSNGVLQIEATANLEQNPLSVLQAIPIDSETACYQIPLAIVNYVARSQESIILSNATEDNRFNQDPYIIQNQPKSVLCTPLLHQGKRSGILYLENHLATDAFTPARLEIVQFLSTQAAISIDNARLYNQLELRVEERTTELTQANDRLQAEILERQRSEQTLRMIVEGTASVTGADFFRSLVRSLAQSLGVHYAFISECLDAVPTRVRSFVFWQGDRFGDEFEYDLHGTPCEQVLNGKVCQVFPDQLQSRFPNDQDLEALQAQSYAGISLLNSSGDLLGHLAVLNDQPIQDEARTRAILGIFAARAAAEMERKQAEDALRVSETKFSTAFQSSPDAITISTLKDGGYIEVNDSCLRMLGYQREEMLGNTAIALKIWANPDDRERMKQQIQHQETITNLEIKLRRKSGEIFPALFSAKLIYLENEPCLLAIAADITMLKQAEKALARLAEIGELAAMIVHEVRNPLTTISMVLNAFKRLELSERFEEYLSLSLAEADRLQRLLNQILLYSKQQVLQRSQLDLNHFIPEALTTLQTTPAATGKPLKFISTIESAHVLADPDKLKQVMINLVTNACEAVNERDPITIHLQACENHQVCIQVHNGGTPIPADVLPNLTQPFFTTKSHGTGLGLAIVKRIVEAHDGEFVIESTAAIGTVVTVQLPLVNLS
jgi:PAS domain S-box-containing protein